MGDVTDRAYLPARSGVIGSRENNICSALGGSITEDLYSIIRNVTPLPVSKNYTAKEVDEIMQSVVKVAGNSSVDWEKRMNVIKTFRSLCADPIHNPQIITYLRQLSLAFQVAVKDLRSQLAREACVTVSYIAYQLNLKAECFVEPLIPTLFSLLVANAKIVSTTSLATIYLVYENVPAWRLAPPLQAQMSSKSKEIRRAACGVLKIIFNNWPASSIQRQSTQIIDILKKGLADADLEARNSTKEAFCIFQSKFSQLAASVLDSLDNQQKRQLSSYLTSALRNCAPAPTNGTIPVATSSLSRQGSLRKTSIPVLASRVTPTRTTPSQGRSTSAIDLQAVNRARQHHFSTMRSPLKTLGRTHSTASPMQYQNYPGVVTPRSVAPANASQIPTLERSRTKSRASRVSQSQPGSRSNSPCSRYAYATYATNDVPYQISRAGARRTSTSSASSSRETSPQGRLVGPKLRSRSISNSPQIVTNAGSSTARLLIASREAEALLSDVSQYKRESLELDFGGNHSDSEDSISSHRSNLSMLSETFSPPNSSRHYFIEDNVEELLKRCGSMKWSERKEGLLGLKEYLNRHGSIPSEYFNKIGQTFCRIFMDAHTKVLSLFLDVLHAVLSRHARDLIDFTTILLNRILTKLGSDLLPSVHSKLIKTLEIIMDEMPIEIQFTAVTHYLCDPTQTPNVKSKVAALSHLYSLSSVPIAIRVNEVQQLVDKLLEWCGDLRHQEVRRMSQKVFYSLFGMAAPQMTLVLSQMPTSKQDQAKSILKNLGSQESSALSTTSDVCGWSAINSGIESLSLNDNSGTSDLFSIITEITIAPSTKKGYFFNELLLAMKSSSDEVLLSHHKDLLKIIFDTLNDSDKAADKALCYYCLDELAKRPSLGEALASFAELFIVRVTEVTQQLPREVTKAAEACAMSVATGFPPDIIVRALCPIIQNSEYPVNQMAIKMLQKLSDCCEMTHLRNLIADIMNTLVLAYDHPDSAVRKAAVFAIVSAHSRLGSELDPYLASLSGSKLKLLQLYIQRANQSAL